MLSQNGCDYLITSEYRALHSRSKKNQPTFMCVKIPAHIEFL